MWWLSVTGPTKARFRADYVPAPRGPSTTAVITIKDAEFCRRKHVYVCCSHFHPTTEMMFLLLLLALAAGTTAVTFNDTDMWE